MLIKEAYHQLVESISNIYENREAKNISDWVIEEITGWDRSKRLIHHDAILNENQLDRYEHCKDELMHGRPIQYVLGLSWFFGFRFFVDERVLIPRPETEELVDLIKFQHKEITDSTDYQLQIIDIGTGSGCIAISLKKIFPHCEMWAIDESMAALEVASKNAEVLQVLISLKKLDILKDAKNDSMPAFDIIVSNPPYIPLEDKKDMADHVLDHEPHQALFVTNNDPLQFYRAIISFSEYHLLRGGMIYFETHENYANQVAKLMEENEFENIQIKKDMQGRDRIVFGKKIGASL